MLRTARDKLLKRDGKRVKGEHDLCQMCVAWCIVPDDYSGSKLCSSGEEVMVVKVEEALWGNSVAF